MKPTEEFPYEEASKYNQPPPKGLDSANLCAYISLRNLYFLKSKGGVDEEQFEKLRTNIVTTFNQLNNSNSLILRCANVWFKAQDAAIAYAKDRTLENADRLYNALY